MNQNLNSSEKEPKINLSRHARALVFLDMPGVPALSLQKQCFEKLQACHNQFDWHFCETRESFLSLLDETEIILCWNFSVDLYARAPKLRAIFTPAAGKDWIEPDPAGRVNVFHSHFHGELMSESLLGMITYFNNSFDQSLTSQHQQKWDRQIRQRVRLKNQHVVIVGYGSIGETCAGILLNLGCRITGVKRSVPEENNPMNGVNIIPFDQLTDVLPEADHVVIILPGDDTTNGIVARKHLSLMKPDAVLHNMGRGNCIKEEDLVWALTNNIIKGAALDVFEQEPLPKISKLWPLKNVLITPHSTCFYTEYGTLFADEVEETLNTPSNVIKNV